MHIEDWDEAFLSELDENKYVDNLKKADINYAMVYLQSHVGLCYYPTKLGSMHKAFEKDPWKMKRLVDACHKEGIKVCGYYSLIFNTREHDKHPQWQIVDENGFSIRRRKKQEAELQCSSSSASRYGHICPNNPDQMNFVLAQIDEILDAFEVDAMFFDMPFWPDTCHCEHCEREYQRIYGRALPRFGVEKPVYHLLSEEKKEEYRRLIRFKSEAMGKYVSKISAYVKSKRSNMPVEHNFAQAAAASAYSGCAEEVGEACDFVGGDLYGDIFNHSFSCKFFRAYSRNQPFEQMFSRCKPSLGSHTLTKTLDQMKISLASTMAHHGASLVIDAIDPVGTMDARLYEKLGQMFSLQKPYEKYFCGEMAEDIGIFVSLKSKIKMLLPNSRDCSVKFCSGLVQRHIPVSVVSPYSEFEKHSFVVAPMLSVVDDKDAERLKRYVKDGGVLYVSGFEAKELIGELTGHKLLGQTEENNVYFAPKEGAEEIFGGFNEKYPLPMGYSSPVVEAAEGTRVLSVLKLPYTKPQDFDFASIHSNPPGILTDIPAITVNSYGKGIVIWSALPIEGEAYCEYTDLLLRLFKSLRELSFSFESLDAPPVVELTLFKNEGFYTLNASLVSDVEKAFKLCPFTVRVKLDKAPREVLALGTGEKLDFNYSNGYLEFETPILDIFEMFRIDL